MPKDRIWIEVSTRYGTYAIAKEIPSIQLEAFEPLRTTDDVLAAMATGDKMDGSMSVMKVIKTRKDAAEVLAKEFAKLIVEHMEKNDTHNGYLKNKSES